MTRKSDYSDKNAPVFDVLYIMIVRWRDYRARLGEKTAQQAQQKLCYPMGCSALLAQQLCYPPMGCSCSALASSIRVSFQCYNTSSVILVGCRSLNALLRVQIREDKDVLATITSCCLKTLAVLACWLLRPPQVPMSRLGTQRSTEYSAICLVQATRHPTLFAHVESVTPADCQLFSASVVVLATLFSQALPQTKILLTKQKDNPIGRSRLFLPSFQ